MSDSPVVESADPEEVLSALSDSTRVDILRALWEADREEIPRVAGRYFRVICDQVAGGFCWYCQGRTDPTVTTNGGDDQATDSGRSEPFPMVRYDCRRCGQDLWIDLANALVARPAVVTFYDDHDVVAREIPPWRFAVLDTERSHIVDRDPLRARVSFTCDDDRLDLVVDENLETQSVERHAG